MSMREITEKTVIPISLVISLVGGILWLANIQGQGQANAKDISRLETAGQQQVKILIEINERLSRIEGKLENHR